MCTSRFTQNLDDIYWIFCRCCCCCVIKEAIDIKGHTINWSYNESMTNHSPFQDQFSSHWSIGLTNKIQMEKKKIDFIQSNEELTWKSIVSINIELYKLHAWSTIMENTVEASHDEQLSQNEQMPTIFSPSLRHLYAIIIFDLQLNRTGMGCRK